MNIDALSVFILDGIYDAGRKQVEVRPVSVMRKKNHDHPSLFSFAKCARSIAFDENRVAKRELIHGVRRSAAPAQTPSSNPSPAPVTGTVGSARVAADTVSPSPPVPRSRTPQPPAYPPTPPAHGWRAARTSISRRAP